MSESIKKETVGYEEQERILFEGKMDATLQQCAKDELHEDAGVREQALSQMREWIEKNPRIKKCRTDDRFLLRFLRVRKFSVMRACETLEKYLTMRQTYPKWCQKLDPQDPDLRELLDSCALLPIGRCPTSGQILILGMVRNFNVKKYDSDMMIRLNMLVTESLIDGEANQITGFTHIFDNSELTMAHVTAWSLENLTGYLRSVMNCIPIRLKQNHFVNNPSFAVQISKYCLSFASEKLKSRIYCHRNMDELRQSVDVDLLPLEYGGKIPLKEMNERFKTYLAQKRTQLLELDDMEIDTKQQVETVHGDVDIVDAGAVGSFRKLQID